MGNNSNQTEKLSKSKTLPLSIPSVEKRVIPLEEATFAKKKDSSLKVYVKN